MRAADLTPDHAVLRILNLLLRLVHVGDFLPKVELRVFLGPHAVDLQKRAAWVLVALA